MNINIDIVARAFIKAGEEPLTPEELETKKGTRWRLIQEIYQATIFEELAAVAWTSMKRRKRLERSEEENLTNYSYSYLLPKDCAKPVALNSEKTWLMEGGILYTEDPDAILIYITNGFTGKYKYQEAETQPTSQEELEAGNYFILVDEDYQKATTYVEGTIYYTIKEEDYNFYDDPVMDPLLEETIETRLAAKIVLKLTGDQSKYQILFQEAAIIENRATKGSFAQGHNKGKGNKYWGEMLGLPDYGED